ncbi:Argininosuccinate lyase [Variovorax sp. PBS-H4]|uniref:Bug family tripartite tricarboxylate transporter substrate binding protein n=1 Tax=Variovorax sp. PBS-H4 TaxID=434008 RepID=UPI001319153B|nr:tripartite tricarboxylate transporter substrate binding protein [Variovorax sp. PBS-H4]VTU22908.1 Argininosuccinate lyase [Variovorax sp. PBS-H4]
MITRRQLLHVPLATAIALPALAQQGWRPAKTITILVPYPAGGLMDAIGRRIATSLSASFKVPVIVDNKPGANTMIGAAAVAKAAADGHTLLLTTDASITINPYLYRKMSYDAERDFAPVTMLCNTVECLIAHPKVPAATLPEFIAWARREGNKVNYGSFGIGSNAHLAGAELQQYLGTELNHVPYKGQADLYQALLVNDIQFVIGTTGVATQYIHEGRLKLIAPLRPKRAPQFPEVPSAAEQGVPIGHGGAWFGFLAPARTPPAAIDVLAREIGVAAQDRDFQTHQVLNQGLELSQSGPQAMALRLQKDRQYYSALIERLRVKLD